MNTLELTTEEASVLYSACLVFADELKGMQSRTASMSPLAEQLGEKAKTCYELAKRIAELTGGEN